MVSGQNDAIAFGNNALPLCHVLPADVGEEDGTLVINIVESLGSNTDQLTDPSELPVSGEPGRIIVIIRNVSIILITTIMF